MFSSLVRIVWKKRRKRRTIFRSPDTERYFSSLDVPTQATSEPKSTFERSPKIDQTSTGNQNQNIGNVDNSTVIRDVYGNVSLTYKRPATGAPFQVPYLPQYFVERPEHHKQIKTRLLSNEANRTGTLVVSAIYGLGGIGKSTLAAAVAHDPEVQAQFPDGVLWVTLGQQPDLLPLLSDWIQALGDHDYKPLTLDGASKHLRTLLHDKKALLVVDDAWNPEHVEPFRVGGSSCRVLVTTREATIRGASSYDLDVMTPNESLELLQKSQTNPLTKAEQQQAQELAETVGYLPLALDLAAAQVADGVSWQELLEDLNLEIAHLESLQTPGADSCTHEEQRKRYSLIASFNLSLRSLTPEMLRQFAWFGVLPEDVVITHTMAATLWEINPRQALTTLRSFKTKALLLAGATGNDQKQTYRLHDLMHDAAKRLLTGNSSANEPEELSGLGLSLTAAHSVLLDRYRSKTQQGLWHTLPDDGYIHANLSWHFEQASRTQELHQLLMEETAQKRNGWYETCERLGQTGNFVTDVARAWRLVEEMFEKNPSESIALQCRYALITTSLNSLAKNIPGHLMAALVNKGLWTPAQGLAYAQQAKESKQRVEALSALAPHLSKSLLSIALDTARSIQDYYDRATALSGLAPHLPEILQEALDTARSIQDDYYRAYALSGLAPHLPPELLQQALDTARSIQDDSNRATALSGLAPHLPEILQEALDTALSIQSDSSRAIALSELAPHLPEILQEALDTALSIQSDFERATALSRLTPHLPPELLQQALNTARSIQDDYYRAYALSEIAPHLPEILQEALDTALSIHFNIDHATALSELAPHLPPELLQQALDTAPSIQDDYYRAYALGGLAPHLPPELLQQALNTARSIQNDSDRATALSGLAPHLPPELLQQALDTALSIQDDYYRAYVLGGLAPHLPPELLQQALDTARSIQDNFERATTLNGLAPHLPPELLQQALDTARSVQNDSDRATALNGLAPHLPEILQEALDTARSIQDDYYRAYALSGLAPHLPEILQEALDTARSIQDDSGRTAALSRLAPHLPPELLQQALDTVRSSQNDLYHAYALSELAPHLPLELLQQALDTARSIQDDFSRAYALSGLAPHLPEILQEALDAARSIQNDSDRTTALNRLAPHLPEILQEALDAAPSIQYDFFQNYFYCVIVWGELIHLPPKLLQQALDIARSIQDDKYRANCFSSLLPALSLAPIKFDFWCEILHNLSHHERYKLLQDIPKLSDVIIALGGTDALVGTVRAIQEVCRQWR